MKYTTYFDMIIIYNLGFNPIVISCINLLIIYISVFMHVTQWIIFRAIQEHLATVVSNVPRRYKYRRDIDVW